MMSAMDDSKINALAAAFEAEGRALLHAVSSDHGTAPSFTVPWGVM